MKTSKKYKFILPVLSITPIIPIAVIATACAKAEEEKGPEATSVTITLDDQELKDQTEFDVKTTKKLQLKAKVEPASANQDVTFQIVAQEGTGNIACSQTGIIYTNDCVGTITVKAVSKTKNHKESNPIELVFWDSQRIDFYITQEKYEEKEIDVAYVIFNTAYGELLQDVCIPSVYVDPNGIKYPVAGTGYGGFNGQSRLRYAHLPKNDTFFKYIGAYSFYQCELLKSITIPDSVVDIDACAFDNCTSLASVTLGSKLDVISTAAFKNCTNLEKLELPDSLTYIGPEAFCQCVSLDNLEIPASVFTIGESAFTNCWNSHISIKEPKNPESPRYFCADEKGVYNSQKTRLLHCQYDYKPTESEKRFVVDDKIKKIDARAFEYCSQIEWVIFSENSECESIGERCFCLCSNMTHCILPNNNKITEIKPDTFCYCWNLVEMEIPESVSIIQKNAFYGCDNLGKINFAGGTSNYPVNWLVANTSTEPAFSEVINVNYYDGIKDLITVEELWGLNAARLITAGYYKDPESSSREWVGGFSNCIWVKNSVPLTAVFPLGNKQFAYNTSINPSVINLGLESIDLSVIFYEDVGPESKYMFDLIDQDRKSVVKNPVPLVGKVGPESFHFEFDSLKKNRATQIFAIVYVGE